MLDERIVQELRSIQQRLTASGELRPQEKLNQYYQAFRDRFGPERLTSLDGEPLLVTIQGLFSANRDTIPYWLEFKNDEEFPAIFGSIAGGSAFKYGVYSEAKTGQWMSRGQGNAPKPVSVEEAIAIARKHREQLIKGVQLLEQLPRLASDEAYAQLQKDMNTAAPDVSNIAWGHKYFSLLFPEKLDDYHVANYQRFHLLRLLQADIPPEEAGRYITAGRYVRIAAELEMPINHLTSILNERTPRPYRYWRVLANYHGEDAQDWQLWPQFIEKGMIAVGWNAVGDLSNLENSQVSKSELQKRMAEIYGAGNRWATELFRAVVTSCEGDIVFAMDRDKVLGVGRIKGTYQYDPSVNACHQKQVEWLSDEPWTLSEPEGKGSVFREIKDYSNKIEGERRILSRSVVGRKETPAVVPEIRAELPPLTSRIAQIDAILSRKGQIILYGPPGTGKTYAALAAARELAARAAYRKTLADLTDAERSALFDAETGALRLITFHPGYGYEEFIEGYRPFTANKQMQFVIRDGIFKQLCAAARAQPERRYFLVIDEINRGDIPRIFGELLTLLEKDKRGQSVLLPVTGEPFSVPANIHIIATMNTADRSIALLDTALRRRFGFIELLPDTSLLGNTVVDGIPLGPWLAALNRRIVDSIGRDARNLQIGHAYFMEGGKAVSSFPRLARMLQEDIIPLLEEYCYDDYTALEKILGSGLVDATAQCIRHELFAPNRQDDLISAILAPMPELTTTIEAVSAPVTAEEDEEAEAENA
ncbi:MAG: AAA family ATPase [Caldilinea sp.]